MASETPYLLARPETGSSRRSIIDTISLRWCGVNSDYLLIGYVPSSKDRYPTIPPTIFSYIRFPRTPIYTNSASSIVACVLNLSVLVWVHQYLRRRASMGEYSVYPVVMVFVPPASEGG